MELCGSSIFLTSSLWYSQEAEVGSVEMREMAKMSLTARTGCNGSGLGKAVATRAGLGQRLNSRDWSCLRSREIGSVSSRRRSSAWGPLSIESEG